MITTIAITATIIHMVQSVSAGALGVAVADGCEVVATGVEVCEGVDVCEGVEVGEGDAVADTGPNIAV